MNLFTSEDWGSDVDIETALATLHDPRSFADGRVTLQFRREPPPVRLVSGVHAVPFLEDGTCVLVRSEEWGWMIPGGTAEVGETPLETVARELKEEAGAVLWSYVPLGADWGHSTAAPYRPHLPHPDFCMLWGWGNAELVGPPDPSVDGETIEEVRAFAVPEAVEVFLATGDGGAAAVVHLAADDRRCTLRAGHDGAALVDPSRAHRQGGRPAAAGARGRGSS